MIVGLRRSQIQFLNKTPTIKNHFIWLSTAFEVLEVCALKVGS